ncbi:MAG: 3'-5' exoribonuclease YhaM family protein [Erysipelotrichaceae bacterium]
MNKKVIDFKEGERLCVNLLLTSIVKGTTNSGAPYLTLTIQDDTKSIEAKMWDVKPEIEKELEVGKVFNFEFEVINYRGTLQLKMIKVLPVIQSEIRKEDFIFKSPISKNDLRNGVQNAINRISNKNIARIVVAVLNEYEADFYDYPAASKIHHSFMGGLATHVNGMLKLAEAIAEIYPSVNRDYLFAGVILHDLGKIEELSSPVVTEYTKEGKLLGHISILHSKLYQVGINLKLDNTEEFTILRHMVLSHHGQLEYGSPVRPMTLEAELLYLIDNIDARINTIEKALDQINEGEFTPKIFALENRTFYKHD